ncbi:VOC family protein [Rheinheimera riviphila]|uniref:VOC family protein n=1 Tax=Rheinheimera riviphila TaxID=1834037 RepID=A0A437QM55_9GAMM|nr:VOC family protein [Rheinheimera riviphila]RVU35585.1 VOC family protein [Rheinheimera riviphila]
MQLSVYALFDGQCHSAMSFYQQVFGGELSLIKVKDSPMQPMFPEALQEQVLNARLTSAEVDISASDWLHPTEQPTPGNMLCLYLRGGSVSRTREVFALLSAQATVTDPLTEQPFGLYGALNDNFGVRWMFHASVVYTQNH